MSTTNPTDVTTEWEELQIKYGNYPERPKQITSEVLSNAAVEFGENKDILEDKSLKELQKLEDDVEEDVLEVYRKKRLETLKRRRDLYKFGEVYHISKDEYVSAITEASKASPEIYVLLHLYSDAKPICTLINRALSVVARRHGEVKFCKAIGSDVIRKFPDSEIPTVIVYKNGTCIKQFSGESVWGGEAVTADCIEWVLRKNGILQFSSVEEDPRLNITTKSSSSKLSNDYYVHYDLATPLENNGTSDDSDDDEEERNQDRRGYSSLLMEKTLRLK